MQATTISTIRLDHRRLTVLLPGLVRGRLVPDLNRHALNRHILNGDGLNWYGADGLAPTKRVRVLRARRIGHVLPVRDDRRDRAADPERVKPLLRLDVPGFGGNFAVGPSGIRVLPVACRFVLARPAVSRLTPALAPPGHGYTDRRAAGQGAYREKTARTDKTNNLRYRRLTIQPLDRCGSPGGSRAAPIAPPSGRPSWLSGKILR
jgi:hypothetical protein